MYNGLSNAGAASKCESAGGRCIDVNTDKCNGNTVTGYCPGPANIRCCFDQTTAPTDPLQQPGIPDGTSYAGFPWWGWIILAGVGYTIYKENK